MASIIGLGHYFPPQVISNNDLTSSLDVSEDWIVQRTGIKSRRRFLKPTSFLAANTAEIILENSQIPGDQIDYLMVGTTTPDQPVPSTAGITRDLLKEKGIGPVPSLDIQQTFVSSLYSLSLSKALVDSINYSTVLFVGAESFGSFLKMNPDNKNIAPIFGDGGGGWIVGEDYSPHALFKILDVNLFTDGGQKENLGIAAPGSNLGSVLDYPPGENEADYFLKMDGLVVIRHALNQIVKAAKDILNYHDLTVDDLAAVVPHQANSVLLGKIKNTLKVPDKKFVNVLEDFGNTGAASIPSALSLSYESIAKRPEPYVLLVGFGAGFQWGAALLEKSQAS